MVDEKRYVNYEEELFGKQDSDEGMDFEFVPNTQIQQERAFVEQEASEKDPKKEEPKKSSKPRKPRAKKPKPAAKQAVAAAPEKKVVIRMAKKKKKAASAKKKSSGSSRVWLWVLLVMLGAIAVALLYLRYFPEEKTQDQAIAATVNGEPIYEDTVDETYLRLTSRYGPIVSREDVLDQLVIQELLLQEAEKEGIVVTEEEVNNELGAALLETGLSIEELAEQLVEQNVTIDQVREEFRQQMIINKLVNKTIISQIEISEVTLREFYEENIDSRFTRVRASHILICYKGALGCGSNRTSFEAKQFAESLRKDILAGADFAELAEDYSDGPSASVGGDLGFFTRGMMVREFEEAAFNTEEGELASKVIQTNYGFHVIWVTNVTIVPFEDAKEAIRSELISGNVTELYKEYIDALKASADIAYPGSEMSLTEQCIMNYNLEPNMLIYYTTDEDWCIYCQQMDNVVETLELEGIAFERIDLKSDREAVLQCFENVPKGIPLFVCPSTGALHSGAMSESQLRDFAQACS